MKKMLIVEDMPELKELFKITVGEDNFDILETDTGEEAIKIAIKEKPSIILMDIGLAGNMDGFQTIKEVKGNPLTKNTKIIIISAREKNLDVMVGKGVGADAYITKPFSPLELIEVIENIMN